MIKVYVDSDINTPILKRYLPDGSHWKDLEITFNPDDYYDYHIIYNLPHNKPAPFKNTVDKDHTFLIWIEPPEVNSSIMWKPELDVMDKLGRIISSRTFGGSRSKYNDIITKYQQATYWMVGVNYLNRDEVVGNITDYANYPVSNKNKLLSMTVSTQSYTKDQIQRQKFAKYLKDNLGDKLDLIITNKDLKDKEDTLRDYQYNITIENSSHDDYWTEKLSDPLLCMTYPIYYGCTNLSRYFDSDVCSVIDIYDFEKSLQIIKDTISVPYCDRLSSIYSAHKLVILKYNLMELIHQLIYKEI